MPWKRTPRASVRSGVPRTPEWNGFEELLDDLLSGFARAPARTIDREIAHWLREIAQALDLDRATVWERTRDERVFACLHWWDRGGAPAMPAISRSIQVSPWAAARILAGEPVIHGRIEETPAQAKPMRAFVEKYGAGANATLSLQVGELILGALSFAKIRGPREWSYNLLRPLKMIAQAFAIGLDRKRVESQIDSLQRQVATVARRAAVGELASSIAHELNQPLAAIVANASALQRLTLNRRANSGDAAEALSDIIDDGNRAKDAIRRLTALFRDDSEKTILQLSEVIAETVSLLQSAALVREISLLTECQQSLPSILGDRIQLQQCIMNLVINAFEAASSMKGGNREVAIKCGSDNREWINVSVRDSGPGLDPTVKEKLLRSSVSTKPDGLGMGLLVTRSIVENHGGRIWSSRNSSGGTTFTFAIPTILAL